MEIKKVQEDSKLTFFLSGKLDYTNADKLDAELESVQGVKELVIDMKELELISSSGLRSMITASELMEGKGTFNIINASPEIKEIFEISGFTDFIEIN